MPKLSQTERLLAFPKRQKRRNLWSTMGDCGRAAGTLYPRTYGRDHNNRRRVWFRLMKEAR